MNKVRYCNATAQAGTGISKVLLKCCYGNCLRSRSLTLTEAEKLPSTVAVISSLCPWHQEMGVRYSEIWLDKDGNEVMQEIPQ